MSVLVTVLVLVTMTLCMGVIGYGATYANQLGCFYNQHIRSGYENIAYDTATPKYTQIIMDFDGDLIYSTGEFRLAVRKVDSSGSFTDKFYPYDTVTVSSKSANIDSIRYYSADRGCNYKAYIYGYNGIHMIVNKAMLYYD